MTSRRRLDVASLALLLVGVICGGVTCWLIVRGLNVSFIVPSIVAIVTGATHITTSEALREEDMS